MVKITSLTVVPFAALLLNACGSDSTAPSEPLTVTTTTPASGPVTGGTSVTIAGTNFVDITDVTIGGSSLVNRTVLNSTQIRGTTPAATSTGTKDVVVTSSTRGNGTCNGCFTYEPAAPAGVLQQITAGWDHTCALTTDGKAYCWGNNGYGTLGNGSRTNSPTPVAVSGGLTFTSIVAGAWHTCALTASGDAYCWGLNDGGQLGNGPPTSLPAISSVPIAVAGGLKFTVLAATMQYTCGLVASGAAYCWGHNEFGQFGNGGRSSSVPATTPVAVSGGLSFSSLDAGGYHTCGLNGGSAYCWGLNQSGEIGNGLQGTDVDALVPTAVLGGLSFSSIFAGFYHSCGLTGAGVAYCWGSNLHGGLGNGSSSGPDYCPVYPNTGGCSLRPIAVAGGFHFETLALGGYHTCGLIAGGVAYCWGANDAGQLGNGSTTDTSGPTVVSGGLSFKAITVATMWYTCGITTSGAAYCWGKNDLGQLGNGTTNDSSTPVGVSGLPPQ